MRGQESPLYSQLLTAVTQRPKLYVPAAICFLTQPLCSSTDANSSNSLFTNAPIVQQMLLPNQESK